MNRNSKLINQLIISTIKRFADRTTTQFGVKHVREYVNTKLGLDLSYHKILRTMK